MQRREAEERANARRVAVERRDAERRAAAERAAADEAAAARAADAEAGYGAAWEAEEAAERERERTQARAAAERAIADRMRAAEERRNDGIGAAAEARRLAEAEEKAQRAAAAHDGSQRRLRGAVPPTEVAEEAAQARERLARLLSSASSTASVDSYEPAVRETSGASSGKRFLWDVDTRFVRTPPLKDPTPVSTPRAGASPLPEALFEPSQAMRPTDDAVRSVPTSENGVSPQSVGRDGHVDGNGFRGHTAPHERLRASFAASELSFAQQQEARRGFDESMLGGFPCGLPLDMPDKLKTASALRDTDSSGQRLARTDSRHVRYGNLREHVDAWSPQKP